MSKLRTALVVLSSLSACSMLSGESETTIDLYNPDTGEIVKCGGYGMHRGSPTADEVDRCVKEHERKGFRPYANADAERRRARADK